MLTSYSKIVNSTVYELKTQTKLGEVLDLTIQKSDFSISGIIMKRLPFSLGKNKVVSVSDVLEVNRGAVVVNDVNAAIDIDEAVRIKEAYYNGLSGIGQKVVTKSGKKVGNVYDYVIDAQSFKILKLYIKNLFSERIISSNSIIAVEKNKIVIKDDFEAAKLTSPAIKASVI